MGRIYFKDGFGIEENPLGEAMNTLRPLLGGSDRSDKVRQRLKTLRCSICPPHRGENAVGRKKHGTQKKRKRWSRD